jgi:hypothetical protein
MSDWGELIPWVLLLVCAFLYAPFDPGYLRELQCAFWRWWRGL